jgi:hypothetical protein
MAQQPPQPPQPATTPAKPLPPPQAVAAPQPSEEQPTAGLDRPGELPFPLGLPYTVYFPGTDGQTRASDLEHPAPVPRVGEIVEYIDERGDCQRYVVREVIHTLQTSASYRPLVDADGYAAASLARRQEQQPELPGDGGELRAGLPKVFLDFVDATDASEGAAGDEPHEAGADGDEPHEAGAAGDEPHEASIREGNPR